MESPVACYGLKASTGRRGRRTYSYRSRMGAGAPWHGRQAGRGGIGVSAPGRRPWGRARSRELP